jgi:hypothetical protein
MNKSFALTLALGIVLAAPARAATDHFWKLVSPDHGQTWAYGLENNRVWKQWGQHLALLLTYTNDPAVDRYNSREWDNFRFDFPNVRIGADGRTFYYRTDDGRRIPVAVKKPDFFGFDEVKLLSNSTVVVSRPHGYLTVYLNVLDPDGLAVQ